MKTLKQIFTFLLLFFQLSWKGYSWRTSFNEWVQWEFFQRFSWEFFFFECIPFPHRWSPGAPIKISLGIFSGIINFFARIVKKEDFWRFLLNDFSENCFRNSFTYPFRMHSHSCIWKFLQEFSRNSLRIFSINFHWLSFRRFGRIFSKDSFWN